MAFWSTIAPIATIAGGAFGGPAGAAAAGALTGALAGNERRDEMMNRQKKSANAAADAIEVSYGRRDGRGSIPQIQYADNGTYAADMGAGALAGGMQGYQLGQQGMFSSGGPDLVPQSGSLLGTPDYSSALGQGANQQFMASGGMPGGAPDWSALKKETLYPSLGANTTFKPR
jgi:hypothetical protein